jgi:hypothetical protein
MKGINEHVIRNSPFVNVKVMKHWKAIVLDDELKSEMSRDSENVRSHPFKPVTTSACAIREPDAIDISFERSLLHWCFSRLTSSLHSTFSCQLLSELDSDLLIRDHRSVQLLTLIEPLSLGHRPVQLSSVESKMAESDDLKSLGQFSNKRITIAQKVLQESSEGVITARPPPPFRDTRGGNSHLLSSEEVANQWIRFGMPPVIVYSAYFANTSHTSEATSEALELAYKLLYRDRKILKRSVLDGISSRRGRDS